MRYLICVVSLSLAAACAGQGKSDPAGEEEGSGPSVSEVPDTVIAPVTPRGDFLGTPVPDAVLKSLSSGLEDFADDAPSGEGFARPEGASEVAP
ncbi:MAG TPA: hypothetical protein VFZ61_32300 [Polyangiales bacterium]